MSELESDVQHAVRLRRYIKTLVFVPAAFVVVECIGALYLRSLSLLVAAVIAAGVAAAAFIGWVLAARGRLIAAAEVIAWVQLVAALACVATLRFLTPALVVLPILSVALGLPFLSGRRLRRLMVSAFLCWVVVVAVGVIVPDRSDIPHLWRIALVIACSATLSLLALFLLDQFSKRIRGALDEATRALRVREEFIAVAAHELRTPLTPLKLQLEGLARGDKSDPVRVSNKVASAMREADRLQTIVETILDVAEATPDVHLRRRTVELGALAEAVAARFEESLRAARCELRILAPEPVSGRWDAARLELVIGNLLDNAIKFGAGKPIELRVSRRGRWAVLSVSDHGIGMSPEATARVFERFERAAPVTSYGGLGLGLYVARTTVEAHGGDISVESRPGAGATFTVRLPLDR